MSVMPFCVLSSHCELLVLIMSAHHLRGSDHVRGARVCDGRAIGGPKSEGAVFGGKQRVLGLKVYLVLREYFNFTVCKSVIWSGFVSR